MRSPCAPGARRGPTPPARTDANLRWLNSLDEGANYTQLVEFVSAFHTPSNAADGLNGDQEYTGFQWWLARTDDGGWQVLTWGY